MKRKDVVVRAPHLGCLCLYNAPHPALPAWVERDISGWYLVHAPFTCSHTYNLFSLLNFADLSCDCEEFSAVNGLRSARWIWSCDSDKEAGWLSSSSVSLTGYSPPSSWAGNTFTLHPTPQQKSNLLVFAFHTSYHSVGMLLNWYHLCVFCMNSTFEKGRNEF